MRIDYAISSCKKRAYFKKKLIKECKSSKIEYKYIKLHILT